MNSLNILKILLQKKINYFVILGIAFLIFLIYYFVNLETFNIFSTDYQLRYKPNGLNIINQIINFRFKEIELLNTYFIPELITGILLKIATNEQHFSILSNFINMFILFLSFHFFFKSFELKNKNIVIILFLIIFFSYIGNWQWCFWKLADVYFLFIFSLIFYFTYQTLIKKKIKYFIYAFIFSLISLITKPQGIICLPFLFLSLINFYDFKKLTSIKVIFLLFTLYIFLYPIFIYFLIIIDPQNILKYAINFMSEGYISATIFYSYNDFIDQFLIEKNTLTEISYYYFLFLKKVFYQITFIRETYSYNHNIFLIFYCLITYGCVVLNFNNLKNQYKLFFNLTILANILSILLHSSLNTADEPNRHQLFNLVPFYILVSMSIFNIKIILKSYLKRE